MGQETIPISADMQILSERANNNFNELFGRAQNNGIPLDPSRFFVDNTARDAAIPTPSEGEFCAVQIKNNEYYLEQYQTDTWIKVSIGNRVLDILYISGQSVNDESYGQSVLTAPVTVNTTTANEHNKIGGAWSDNGMNSDFETSPNNSLKSNVKNRFVFTGASVIKVDKPCVITLYLYRNGVPYISTNYSFATANSEKTPTTSIGFEVNLNDIFEIYISSSVANTEIYIGTLVDQFELVKKHY